MALCPSAVFHKEQQYAEEELLFAALRFGICEAAFEYQPRRPEESVLYRAGAAYSGYLANCFASSVYFKLAQKLMKIVILAEYIITYIMLI